LQVRRMKRTQAALLRSLRIQTDLQKNQSRAA
jgi:hypothetical protein